MRVTRAIAIAVIAASMGVGFVQAQSLSSSPVPAEFPPSSFKGRQYVDSNGCVFIRAGIDGNITWVPRVSRDRKVICGFQPSIAKKAPAKQPTVKAATAAKPAKVTKPKKTAEPVAVKPKPVKKVVRKVKPAPKPVTVTAKPVAVAPQPVKVVKKPAKPVKKPEAKRVARQSACQGGNAVSRKYLVAEKGMFVRCGPQKTPHVNYGEGGQARRVVQAAAQTRVAPKHVYENQVASQQGIFVPEGYKLAWDDDRLNPKRAHQTLDGKAQMDVVWTKTVPRHLIIRETGQDVSYKYPGLQYPYTSFAEQRAAGVVVSTQGRVVAEPVRVVRVRKNVKVAAKATAAPETTAVPKVTVSTRSAMPEKAARAASHRYVRAGVFASSSDAKKAAQRIANSGLPARMGTVKSKGKTYTMVLSGPFKTQAQLTAALGKVRGFGFRNATLRK